MANGEDTSAHPGRKVDINAHLAAHNAPIEAAKREALESKFTPLSGEQWTKLNAALAGKGLRSKLMPSGMVGYED